jgi:hypothetical protein
MSRNAMSDREAMRWERQRAGGLLRFMLIHGVVMWGLPTALLAAVVTEVASPLIDARRTFVEQLGFNLVAMPFGGILYGWVLWNIRASQHRRWLGEARRVARSGTSVSR